MRYDSKNDSRKQRKIRIRKKISGTGICPRLVVFRSNTHIYAQVVDDTAHATLFASSTLSLSKASGKSKSKSAGKSSDKLRCNKAGAELLGKEIARLAKEKNIERVVFDRNGYLYHGRIKAVADGAREGGLKF